MIALELAAALLGMAAAPQYIKPDRQSATVRPATRATTRPAATRPIARGVSAKTDQRQTRNHAQTAACGKTHKGYDARTDTFRDARGKRQNCPR
ncbi:hypothetical protein U1737_08420 [Sphingomonas sp. LB3N6]|uniref:hypothetical protein n=1 Tax=Sphingomonas fucosidasi TaxID=3096164 RepID=UPI002FCBF0FF